MAGNIPNFVPGEKAHLYEDILKATMKNINYLPGKPKEEKKEEKIENKKEEIVVVSKPKAKKPKE